jgi:hypothetical protein
MKEHNLKHGHKARSKDTNIIGKTGYINNTMVWAHCTWDVRRTSKMKIVNK